MAGTTVNWKDDSKRNHDMVYRFEKAFNEGKNPQVKDYLEGEGPTRWQLLMDLLHSNLELRIRAGQSLRVQDYLKEHGELAQHADDLASLIKTEIRCLRQMGIYPMLHKYQADYGSILGKRVEELFAQESRGTREAKIGSIIAGKYKLLAELGEGGMGSVYAAEQTQPVRRTVAIKLIKPGMDSSGVLARFEAERQALAMMDHPNIARMLDGGITDDGQPYFVMEQVKGLPITKFCDQEKLSLDDRIQLFMAVCQGVQHAHQKGIIHRDLKPSNILVTLIDGKPVPKVIDFGVAKALHQKLTDKTMYTEAGRMVGTLEYMAPEQADLNNLDVDTRADVYALGVVLYELLTGQVPFTGKELRSAAYDEMLRIIREMEPPRPSTKLSSSLDLPKVAALRQADPKQITSLMTGELDWIVMKCLEKERGRRYETANALGRELGRYLADEPVEAKPPSVRYRVGKFVRRNRVKVVAAGLLALALVAGVVGTSWGLFLTGQAVERERDAKEKAERRLAQIEKGIELFAGMLKDINPNNEEKGGATLYEQLQKRAEKVAEDLDGESVGDPLAVARLQTILGSTLCELGSTNKAIEILEKARVVHERELGCEHLSTLGTLVALASAYQEAGRLSNANEMLEQVRVTLYRTLGPDHPDTLSVISNLAANYQRQGRLQEAFKLHEEVLMRRKSKLGPNHIDTIASMHNLALCYYNLARHEEALKLQQEVVEVQSTILGPNHFTTLSSMSNLAGIYSSLDRHLEALNIRRTVLERQKAKLGSDHIMTLGSVINLAGTYSTMGQRGDAAKLCEEALLVLKAKYPDHHYTFNCMGNLADHYFNLARYDEAVKLHEQVLSLRKTKLGPGHPDTLWSMGKVAASYKAVGRREEALKLMEEALVVQKAKLGTDHLSTLGSMVNIANHYAAIGRRQEALKLFEEALPVLKAKYPGHKFMFNCMGDLAIFYTTIDRKEESLKLFKELLALQKVKLGPDHADTLRTMSNLVHYYVTFNRHQEALKLRAEMLTIMKEKLGSDHPDTLKEMHTLAINYHLVGRYLEAIGIHYESLKLRKSKLGPDHPDTLLSQWGLVESLIAADRGAEAVPIIDDCLTRAVGKAVHTGLIPSVAVLRIHHFRKEGDASGCRSTAELWEKLNRTDPASLYNAGCFRAITSECYGKNGKSVEAATEADLAMSLLQKAMAAGFTDLAQWEKDKALDCLRGRDDFKKLKQSLQNSEIKTKKK